MVAAADTDLPSVIPTGVSDLPQHWLHNTPLLDLDDPKLRLKARSLTQLAKGERERALAVYGFVKRIPYTKRIKTRYPTSKRSHFEKGCAPGPVDRARRSIRSRTAPTPRSCGH